MAAPNKQSSRIELIGWGSALLSFGMVQGSLYLKAFWSRFGLDPFQFVGVGELALVGLTSVGVTLAMMCGAALIGGCAERWASVDSPRYGPLKWVAVLVLVAGTVALMWMSNGWPLLLGFVLSMLCIAVLKLSPIVPSFLKESPWLPYGVVAIVYVSLACAWLGDRSAKRIVHGMGKHEASITLANSTLPKMTYVGRLGGTYVLWDKKAAATILVSTADVRTITLARAAKPSSSSPPKE